MASEALAEKSSFEVNLNDDKKTAIAEILRLGTSAGGQRAKAIIAYKKRLDTYTHRSKPNLQ